MCLDTIDSTPPEKTEGWGWQVMLRVDAEHCTSRFSLQEKPRGEWLMARPEPRSRVCVADLEGRYEPGFHLFKTSSDAVNWDLYNPATRVQYRGAYLTGAVRDDWRGKPLYPVIVAKEIRIPLPHEDAPECS